jgi:flavin-dependent dehydrogenase
MKRFTDKVVSPEEVDAVVVGARIAGAATAIALARRGRKVIALDRAKFPSDTISAHVPFATGAAELKWLGALDRVRRVGAPEWQVGYPNTVVLARTAQRLEPRGRMTPVNEIDYGLNTRRPGLDLALVEAAREAGAEVREGVDVVDVMWAGGRAAGVRYKSSDGALHEIRAKLVVGADRLARWAWRAARRPHPDWAALAREVLDELRHEALLRRDLAIVASGRRADYRRFSRWGRNGWSPQTTPRRLDTTAKVSAA